MKARCSWRWVRAQSFGVLTCGVGPNGTPVEAALREFERRRIPRTSAVVNDSWRSGRILQLGRAVLESLRNWFLESAAGRYLGVRTLRKLLKYPMPEIWNPPG